MEYLHSESDLTSKFVLTKGFITSIFNELTNQLRATQL